MRQLLVLAALFFSFPVQAAVAIDYFAPMVPEDYGGSFSDLMTPVGNAGNAPDTPSTNCFAADCGSVAYDYWMSKYETTNAAYVEFLNAKAASDPLGLYNTSMGSDATFGGITRSGVSGGYTYTAKLGFESKPVVYVSFYDALRFANWLNNGEGNGDTETGAYTLLGGTATPSNGLTVTRNGGANIFLPSENEWYKAAYYSPGGVYFDYPTGTDAVTDCVASGSDTGNSANCSGAGSVLTNAGAYGLSDSPYGTYDQGGNVFEWNEQIVSGSFRGWRGGSWFSAASSLAASTQGNYYAPTNEYIFTGFRVASLVPEPGPGLLGTMGVLSVLGLAASRRRRAN